ncbi:probable WRKY transcription factor 29 [Cucurbita pepo subsp. pepo]|uniref:probable WRKY transcription factor 29 n=1 Tax=Cucurbita pepo subsp. pepo TaxID=3664 RepID=UPI000C9D3E86|nr:probable WRKY transcription factor 29 [Cucurbita pepo subsp. pepo]
MEDWDLQAIVKGCSGRPTSMLQDPFFSFLSEEDDFSCDFSSSSSCSSHEFEGFGSSIFPVFHPLIPYPNNSAAISDLLGEFKEPQKLLQKKQISATKQKQSKKSRQNRVVKEVKADSVCSDSWGWRKYGQKPIKGSPYPRSYYRCSSSKGCSARKQVERSFSDPDVFIVTYTAEHNHAEPTRRNALAGTTRKKFPAQENPSFDVVLSPNNSTCVASIEEEQPMEGVGEGGVLMHIPFEFSSEDLFTGLEDLLFG